MAKQRYVKPALTIPQQVDFLSKQGLVINDSDLARQVLRVVSYYRFSGYLLPFKLPHNNKHPRQFQQGTTFEEVWQLYQFDRELRLLVSDAIEKIEVAFRTALVNVTSVEFNPFWYTERSYFRNEEPYILLMKNVHSILKEKQELFLQHYFNRYESPHYPPLWMMIETFSFGVCSKLFKNIKSMPTRREIANHLGQHNTIIESWLRTLSYTRNLCAHHARLWNRWFVNPPLLPKHEPLKEYFFTTTDYKFHTVAYVIQKLLMEIAPNSQWKQKLFELFEKYEHFPGEQIGFTKKWRIDPFWEI